MARTSTYTMSQSDGTTDVPASRDSCYPKAKVRKWPVLFFCLLINFCFVYRPTHYSLYLQTESSEDGKEEIGNCSCVTRFIKSLILLLEHGAKAHLRHLSEFFGLLYEFSRMGDEETLFLLRINVIRSVSDFYLGNKNQDSVSGIKSILFIVYYSFSHSNVTFII